MKTKIILFALLLTSAHFANSQDVIEFRVKNFDADSLVLVIKDKEGKEKIDALNYLSNVLCRKNTDSSIICATQALQLSKHLEYRKGIADSYYYLGNDYYLRDSLRPTITNYLKALRIYEDLDPTEEYGNLLWQLAVVNALNERWENALPYCKESLVVYGKINDIPGIRVSTVGLALVCKYLAVSDSALYYHYLDSALYYNYKALDILEQYPNQKQFANVCNEMGINNGFRFWDSGDTVYLTKAISWFVKGLESIDPESGWRVMLTYNINAYYEAYGSEDSTAIGKSYLNSVPRQPGGWSIADKASEMYYQGNVDSALVLYHIALDATEEEIASFTMDTEKNPSQILRGHYGAKGRKKYIHNQLHMIYNELGKEKLALEHYKIFKKTEEELHEKETQDLIDLLELESQEEKRKSQIIIMGQENELKDSKLSQARMANYGMIAFVFVLGLVGVMFVRQNKIKNEHKTVLLEQKLLRLQMNPHFIFNALSNILNFVDKNDNKNASNYLGTFSKLLRTTLESTREDMVPFEKEVSSLENYLELQKLRYKEKFDYHVEVDENIDKEDMSIPPMLVQPFIENAIEHGIRHKKTPGRIDVRFFLKDKKILCEVEDDGVGRKNAWEAETKERASHKSLATDIIKDRIKNLNRKFKQKIQLEIIDKISENAEATGTKVLLDLPFRSVYE